MSEEQKLKLLQLPFFLLVIQLYMEKDSLNKDPYEWAFEQCQKIAKILN